eukprot:TRINITY_DN3508_c0_g5_i1.p1 TRINITY_DN3508_c0_g5~~TRINITY_DN3508_c0_g5_i1.p1  ORF type:complete len:359 (+),score=112.33 TRINITY_DN3508_c0_g5_i1:64-1140(+)
MAESSTADRRMFYLTAFLKCAAYLSVGPTLIVLNKSILEAKDIDGKGFRYPVTLSSLGQIFIAITTYLAVRMKKATISDEAQDYVNNGGGWKGCVAVGVFKAMTLSFGNIVYLHLNMGYIQMLKAFSPVLMLFLLFITGVEGLPTCQVASSVLAIAAFTAATTAVESHATTLGLFYMAMAQSTEAGALVVTQKLLKKKKFSIVESQYYLSPPSAAGLLMIAAATGEYSEMYRRGDFIMVTRYPVKFFLAASLGLLVNYLTFAVIQATSSTMLKVLGTVRNVVAVIAGATIFHEHIPMNEWYCYAGTLCGFSSYTYYSLRAAAQPAAHREEAAVSPDSQGNKEALCNSRIRTQSSSTSG